MPGPSQKVTVGIVGGSDLVKIREQLGDEADKEYDYLFSENGLMAFKQGELLKATSFKDHLGEEKLKKLPQFHPHLHRQPRHPDQARHVHRVPQRHAQRVSPIGRNCSQEERDEFEKYDKQAGVREKFVKVLQTQFAEYDLTYSVGGQISFDVFPRGWDKTYCLQFVTDDFDDIHFFGDKTYKGGNDHEIFESARTIGHTVTSPEDTRKQVQEFILDKL